MRVQAADMCLCLNLKATWWCSAMSLCLRHRYPAHMRTLPNDITGCITDMCTARESMKLTGPAISHVTPRSQMPQQLVLTWCDDLLCSKNSLIDICCGEVLSEQVLAPQLPLLVCQRLCTVAAAYRACHTVPQLQTADIGDLVLSGVMQTRQSRVIHSCNQSCVS